MRLAPTFFVLSLALTGANALADHHGKHGTKFAPVFTDEAYKFQPTVALMTGSLDQDFSGDEGSDTVSGIELGINCPLLTTPSNRIRQRISVSSYDNDTVEMSSFELNPHYMWSVADGLEVGVGPGFGYVQAEQGNSDDSTWGVQLGVSAEYRRDMLFAGAEVRYQTTGDVDLGGAEETDLENVRVMFKIGVDFGASN
ncbi:MAG: porin family protein [Granulosicoccaceae bacterium]